MFASWLFKGSSTIMDYDSYISPGYLGYRIGEYHVPEMQVVGAPDTYYFWIQCDICLICIVIAFYINRA